VVDGGSQAAESKAIARGEGAIHGPVRYRAAREEESNQTDRTSEAAPSRTR
jgi:hypothetical protein